MAIGLLQINLDYFDAFFYDLNFRLRPSPSPSGAVSLVLMDLSTIDALNGTPNYADHYRVLSQVLAENPKAVVYITPLVPTLESDIAIARGQSAPAGSTEDQLKLINLIESSKNVFQMVDGVATKSESEKLKLPTPFHNIRVLSGTKTRDSGVLANDGVTRRTMVDYDQQSLGHLQLAKMIRPDLDTSIPLRGNFDFYDTRQLLIDFSRPGTIPTLKFESIYRGDVRSDLIAGKIVLIGDDFQKAIRAYIQTPFSRDPVAMSYLEMHGNMLETFIRNSAPVPSPRWLNFLITALISILTIHAVLTMRPTRGLLVLASGALGTFLFSFLMFWAFGLCVQLAHPFLAIFICYYFFIPYRLIVENRRSWEYYQKHQLLQQVELLKTNFISMMSHDLKTPIARIQGMTDVILKDKTVLSSEQREAVDHIRSSGDDLHRFINAILNYAKIESEGVELHTESRDINDLLTTVVRKNEFLAKVKNIELITEFEPLFSIKLDPELMKQVFSNLVENAIKYSPENSKILISSEERDGWIIVQVADQGPGIPADELQNIFVKFFRSRNAKASPIKGSGLGLYLAKYFVELHNGRISVESQPGQGSTFCVELPINATP